MSTRQIEVNLNEPTIHHVKAWRILKSNGYKPFKLHVSQQLLLGDAERRLNYCTWLRGQINTDGDFLKNILWSDECKFTNCGIFNRKNEHVWSIENPRENREIRKQVRFSVNVWAGIYGDKVIGPFLFEENLNGDRYLEFLNTEFQEYLSDIPLDRLRRIWFQQDGAPPPQHKGRKEFLKSRISPKMDWKWWFHCLASAVARPFTARFLFVGRAKKCNLQNRSK